MLQRDDLICGDVALASDEATQTKMPNVFMDKHYKKYTDYKEKVDKRISDFLSTEFKDSNIRKHKRFIFEPIDYIMSGSGKRIRPLIVILSCESFGGNVDKALDAAGAIEILHNFTLVHDDIMDNALSRRGKETVHKKWDTNTAILTGDELLALAYKLLLRTKSDRIPEIAQAFTQGVLEVCEGQSMDKGFENSHCVTLNDYLLMISKKTAAMVKMSARIGAMIGGANTKEVESIGGYAENIGMAFQIQDDLLDVYSDSTEFGKTTGGDILENKKTFLYLKAMDSLPDSGKNKLKKLFESNSNANKINEVMEIYNKSGVIEAAKSEIKNYTETANAFLKYVKNDDSREMLGWFSDMLLNRSR